MSRPERIAAGPKGLAIAQVVTQFRAVLPLAPVYVYDNNSTD